MLGAFCGVAVAYIVSMAYFRSQLEERLGQVPVVDIVSILIALPLVASFGGWLMAGREPADIGRQPIE
jgi:cytochrome bd-type quinol oxidase subunit 1